MKPDQEMRADMEEPDLEPCDVFVDLGMLVIEGRTAGVTSRGYGEGPHCPKLGTQIKHCCNPQDTLCARNEQFRKHMLLLWRNNIPMSIEVLLSPEATQGNPKSQKNDNGNNYTLLEQWTIHMLPKRVPDVLITGKSLLHAVRSYLHFSQLSAWYSLSTGKIPSNVVYRICVPGEAFINKFNDPPDTHSFPVANVGRNNAVKVNVKSMPRCSGIPHFLSHKLRDSESEKMNMACALDPEQHDEHRSPSPPECCRREKSPNTLLGDSLLDPPQSLRMYPKRFQSPSRCGSPVMEAPDHVLCRSSSRDHVDNMSNNFDASCERSRSRRPFDKNRTKYLEKDIVDDVWEEKKNGSSKVANNNCLGFALTPKETEEVLNLLHRRNSGVKSRNKCPPLDEVYDLKRNKEIQVWNTKEISSSETFGVKEKTSFHRHFDILERKIASIDLDAKCDESKENDESLCHKEILQTQNIGFSQTNLRRLVPNAKEKSKFRHSLDSAASLVFHCKTGLPMTSSPAPVRKGTCFDFDSSLTSPTAIKNALYEKEDKESQVEEDNNQKNNYLTASVTNSSLLGSFEESVLNGRLEPVSTVEGFSADIAASGSFIGSHFTVPVTVFFYSISDSDKVSTPYLGHIKLGPKGYNVPRKGTIQVTFFNPHRTVVKMFVVTYDLNDMPTNCQTFLRQRTFYMPVGASVEDQDATKWLRYLIHLRLSSGKTGRISLHTDVRIVIFRKSEMDAATISGAYELKEYTSGPTNPKFSPLR